LDSSSGWALIDATPPGPRPHRGLPPARLARAGPRRSGAGHSLRADRKLEHVDVALIDRAEHEIDMTAQVLTDWPVMQALTCAADRGVKVRIYLDGTQLAEREPAKVFRDLAETPGVEIRTKHKPTDPMHLKSYQIDGRLLRTGAANFSASGLKRQDNDLIVIESAEAAAAFMRSMRNMPVEKLCRPGQGE
jgi:phosphatidylserine/phosphatidylglycerophosphate/cardiolipin synthase-like enzyme